MTVTFIPSPGSVFRNFQIVTDGSIFDDVTCLFKQGTWQSGKLNGANCTLTNYIDITNVNIRVGVFTSGKENGAIYEYIFPKSDWLTFIATPVGGIDSTRYTRIYTNGILTSTSETITGKKIQGTITYNSAGNINGFSFIEI